MVEKQIFNFVHFGHSFCLRHHAGGNCGNLHIEREPVVSVCCFVFRHISCAKMNNINWIRLLWCQVEASGLAGNHNHHLMIIWSHYYELFVIEYWVPDHHQHLQDMVIDHIKLIIYNAFICFLTVCGVLKLERPSPWQLLCMYYPQHQELKKLKKSETLFLKHFL